MTLIQNYALSDGITFGQTTLGPTTVTLNTQVWSTISGIRKGYRFLLDNEAGEAVILDDPQFESNTLNVNIISELASTTYTSGNWILRVPRTKELKTYLPRTDRTSIILTDYLDSLQNVGIDEIYDAIIRLRNIRRWDKMDPEYLDIFLQTLGLTIKTEEFDVETRRRFVKEFSAFIELSGTRFFLNYLSFVIDRDFSIYSLWSNDYKQFLRREDIPGGDETGWYPTNHVDLEFNATIPGLISTELVIEIFYKLASTPLVIQRINQVLDFPDIEIHSPSLIYDETYETFEDITP